MYQRKKSKRLQEFNPEQCPECNSWNIHATGELQEGRQPWHCRNCSAQWFLLWEVDGLIYKGMEYHMDDTKGKTYDTLDIIWWEIRRADNKKQFCLNCQDFFDSLYTMAADDEAAANDPDSLCWDCGGVSAYFPENEQIHIPTVFK